MTRTAFPARGLYAITDSALHTDDALTRAVTRAIAGGAAAIQYRDKSGDARRRRREADQLLLVCRHHGVPLIINDDVTLALDTGADGVHLGRDDPALTAARSTLGDACIIGVSCYNSAERAATAERDGADYVAFGSMFASTTKPRATRADLHTLTEVRARTRLPIVAIGGITPQNGASLLEAGVDLLAVVRGVFGAADPAEAARRYAALFASLTRDPKP